MNITRLENWIDNKIAQNLFIWFCLYIILLGSIHADNKFLAAFFSIALLAPAIYINNLFILPLLKDKTVQFFLLFTINTLVFSTISVYLIILSIEDVFSWEMLLNFTGIMILALAFGTAIKIARDSFERRKQEREAELKLLKAQLNPHFLFNTLNNLYGLSVVKSDKLPELMLKLSDLLRYSLYDTKETFVPLEKEVQYLENYTALEKIRLEDKTQIQFNCNGNSLSKTIAPMLLIVFVENAFKHLGKIRSKQNKVLIDINIDEKRLLFKCVNSFDEINQKDQQQVERSGGIGLHNAQKRLELMYAGKHHLNVEKKDGLYIIELHIEF